MPATLQESKPLHIQVVYALPYQQHIVDLEVSNSCTAINAVRQSGLLEKFVEPGTQTLKLGIFGKTIAEDTTLEDGMRIEIYRPLLADPKESRRERARVAKAQRTR